MLNEGFYRLKPTLQLFPITLSYHHNIQVLRHVAKALSRKVKGEADLARQCRDV
jgi:ABC-type Fe3+-citrate transport system substrate-binding protein